MVWVLRTILLIVTLLIIQKQRNGKDCFDKYLVGNQRTNLSDPKENVTDSAAGATAFSSGHKTYNGAIGLDDNKKKSENCVRASKREW